MIRRPVVLIVEDEPILRMMAVDMVAEAGFVAVEATDAAEAVRILEVRTDIRLVFADIDMPGTLDGMTLAAAIRRRWPPVEIILTSGQYLGSDVELPSRGVFVPKPYDPAAVVALMARMAP